ncbi:hypothetical protein MBLNU459_g4198t1 [Dothideomycetes sp. NU459]
MPFGILDSSRLEHVPGTSLLETDVQDGSSSSVTLERGKGRHATTVLVPQPSNSLDDPLRWPLWQRDMILILFMACTILCVGGIGPLLSSSALILVKTFHIDFTQVTLLTGYQLAAVGSVGVFVSALCHKFGKRPGVVISMAFALIGTIWGGAAKSYGSLVGARVVQGVGVPFFESVMFAVIGDLYFVHERGVRVAALTVAISGLSNLPAVLSGLITTDLGWRWMFWMLTIFLAIFFVLVCLLGWETAYTRDAIFNTDITSTDDLTTLEVKRELQVEEIERMEEPVLSPRKPLLKRLALVSGTYSNENILIMVARPFIILANPAVIWSTLLLSITTAWFVVISFVIAQIFSSPPYLLNAANIGYMSAGPTVGGLVGSIICGLISDPTCTWLAKKNHGIYEPEFRLVLLIPMLITGTLGFFLFGNLVTEGQSPATITVMWGIASMSIQFCSCAIGTYMIDAYRAISVEVFIIGMVVKNFLFFGLSFGVNDWVTAWGPARVFDTIGGIQIGLCLISIPVWIWGKQWRAFFHSKHIS